MYQCYMVQELNGRPYNIILGTEFASINDALRAANNYEEAFGKCVRGVIEESGKEIPTEKPKKEKLKDRLHGWLRLLGGF